MDFPLPNLVFFGWPSHLGGAATKLAHLLILLHRHSKITVVPNERRFLHQKQWTRWMDGLGIKYCLIDQLAKPSAGYGLALSNQRFFVDRICLKAKELGLKIVWSSEMMWHHEGEVDAARTGLVDRVLYVSEVQKAALSENYGSLPSAMTGNYIDPSFFPLHERRNVQFTIGRLSRLLPEKYPEDFPVCYECLDIPECRFRVMAWDDQLSQRYKWHKFDHRWSLLRPEQEKQAEFLHSLNLFVYPLGHFFTESWGRSTVEAMLTGCIPLVPPGHHLDRLIISGETGFICDDFREYQRQALELYHDCGLRSRMARQCRDHAVSRLCQTEGHRRICLEEVFA